MNDTLNKEVEDFEDENSQKEEPKDLSSFLSADAVVGDLLSLDYNHAIVLVHDYLRQKVGGLPMGCFLLASRLKPGELADAEHEDTSLIFLRVTDHTALANHAETEKYRLDAGRRAIDTDQEWDSKEKTDQFTLHVLRHAGVRCSVLGTFRMKEHGESLKLTFGADISNFYSGQGMKIYKPMGESLEKIVNYTKPTGKPHDLAGHPVHIGHVRYSSSETKTAEKIHVPVGIEPTDLLARRTALFGMSRSGKSNTIKIIASSVFNLRDNHKEGRIGQLIFDVNGEYCNVNEQDSGCLRNVWRDTKSKKKEDVVTYGLIEHPYDTGRQILKINFLGNEPQKWDNSESVDIAMESLIAGKEIINDHLANESALYVKAFINTNLEVPSKKWKTHNARVRYRRAIIAYRSLLHKAGFEMDTHKTWIKGLFSADFRKAFKNAGHDAADTLGSETASWGELSSAFSQLQKFIDSDDFDQFDQGQMAKKRKDSNADEEVTSWADDTLTGILSLYKYSSGAPRLRELKEQHSSQSQNDYSEVIAEEVRSGKMVIVDSSIGSEKLIKLISNRIMEALFNAQKRDFVTPKMSEKGIIPPRDVVVYIEEAHNLLPKKGELTELWPRIAKEGSKYHIGMVFSTQEPSSIMSNILKNTDNWFVAHLNNKDEVRELEKYYDFGEFVHQILKVPDTGFLRMRCLSNPYIVPIQVKEFKAPTGGGNSTEDDPQIEEKQ